MASQIGENGMECDEHVYSNKNQTWEVNLILHRKQTSKAPRRETQESTHMIRFTFLAVRHPKVNLVGENPCVEWTKPL